MVSLQGSFIYLSTLSLSLSLPPSSSFSISFSLTGGGGCVYTTNVCSFDQTYKDLYVQTKTDASSAARRGKTTKRHNTKRDTHIFDAPVERHNTGTCWYPYEVHVYTDVHRDG